MPLIKIYIRIFILLVLLPVSLLAQQEEFTLTGVYNGKNLYVQNPLSSNMKDYCTIEVWVNGSKVMTSPRASAYTVNLSSLSQKSPVSIRIVHNSGCTPKIINPQVIRTKTNFRYLAIHLDKDQLEWVTSGELANGKFFIEKWEGDKWKTLETMEAKGQEGSRYRLAVDHQPAMNRYRIKYLQSDGESFYSSVQTFEEPVEKITFAPTRVSDRIFLSRETEYVVTDPKGNELVKGHGKEIKLGHLTTGLYYLTIENRKEKFFKK